MFKLLYTSLLGASAVTTAKNELFLARKANLDKDLINTKLDIDIVPSDIAPCQYVTETSVFSFADVMHKGSSAQDKLSDQQIEQQTMSPGKIEFNFCEKKYTSGLSECTGKASSFGFIYDSAS